MPKGVIGTGHGGHGASRSGSSSGHGGGYDGGKHSGYSDPSGGNKGYGGKQSGGVYPSSGSKRYGEKTYSAKGSKDSKEENIISPYGQGTPNEWCQRFFNEMSESRQEFAKRRSAYFEAREDPKANPEDIALQQKEIRELFRAIEGTNTRIAGGRIS